MGTSDEQGPESPAAPQLWIPVQGLSMWPALRPGDQAGFAPLSGAPNKGQVLVARIGGRFVIHRVVSVGPEQVILRGDNVRAADPPLRFAEVGGAVSLVRRRGQVLTPQQWDWPGWSARPVRWVATALVRVASSLSAKARAR